PDAKRVASASYDQTVRVWDVETGREVCRLLGHGNGVRGVAFSPDGQRLATASEDQTVRLWDADKGKGLHRYTGHQQMVAGVGFCPDNAHLISGGGGNRYNAPSGDFSLRLWAAPDLDRPAPRK